MSNAIKFTHEGSVFIDVSQAGQEEAKIDVHFRIIDTGIGIKESRKQAIFESFVQGDSSTVRKYGGTGLGTTISKRLVSLMGGSIGFQSSEGIGSTFYSTLPLIRSTRDLAERSIEYTGVQSLQGHTLLVEDYPPNRMVVESLLTELGLSWKSAENGRLAVELFKNEDFDLILMDVQMPEMDGCEATEQIRRVEQEKGLSHTPIIGLTANAFPHDVDRYLQLGMDTVLVKPIRRKLFFSKIAQIINGNEVEKSSSPPFIHKGENIFDVQGLLREMNSNSDVVDELLTEFIRIIEIQIVEIKEHLTEGRYSEAHRDVHSIKGGAANLFAHHLSSRAQMLEAIIKNETEREGSKESFQEGWEQLYAEMVNAYQLFLEKAKQYLEKS